MLEPNSRKAKAMGNNYCTIMNGIIHSKPGKKKVKDANSEKQLKEKLRSMEESRSKNQGKKKKWCCVYIEMIYFVAYFFIIRKVVTIRMNVAFQICYLTKNRSMKLI